MTNTTNQFDCNDATNRLNPNHSQDVPTQMTGEVSKDTITLTHKARLIKSVENLHWFYRNNEHRYLPAGSLKRISCLAEIMFDINSSPTNL